MQKGNILRGRKYSFNMKKLLCMLITALTAAAFGLTACAPEGADYTQFISEKRTQIYLYEEDGLSVKVHISLRESPYVSDGYCGPMESVCEIFASFSDRPQSVEAKIGEAGGEMSYMSVSDSFYLSFSGGDLGDSAAITLTCDGRAREIDAPSVLYEGVISCEEAVICASQYDGETFAALTDGDNFEGEIYVRLIADEGRCYYYVGVCDRNANTSAYLVDGERGNIIAERKL